ncbi:hypothetical protein MUG78_17660 [Gordonia alkaliphila]|uniref:hypothetical protein n=1 Tax=Gordonia alkaliphila TaxID=1053547 RepID=UPI001FF296A8|nr:hypothetical protein [Gordonia alkaliphila]MCK0441228.1 hypothetical protein [Gordonia alkaliphila]
MKEQSEPWSTVSFAGHVAHFYVKANSVWCYAAPVTNVGTTDVGEPFVGYLHWEPSTNLSKLGGLSERHAVALPYFGQGVGNELLEIARQINPRIILSDQVKDALHVADAAPRQ